MENSNITPEEVGKSMAEYFMKRQGCVMIDKDTLIDICHSISDEMKEQRKSATKCNDEELNKLLDIVLELEHLQFTAMLIRELFATKGGDK